MMKVKCYKALAYNKLLAVGLEKHITIVITNDMIYFDEDVDLDNAVSLMKQFVEEYEKLPPLYENASVPNTGGKVVPFPVMR